MNSKEMLDKEILDKIAEEIQNAAPPLKPEHAVRALDNTDVYCKS